MNKPAGRLVAQGCAPEMEMDALLLAAVRTSLEEELPSPARGGLASWQKQRIERHLLDNVESEILVTELAATVHLSASHFYRAFRVSFGASPRTVIRRHRVERATLMLERTGVPLVQIAYACGFADQPHFSRVFRAHMGSSPGQWRSQALAFASTTEDRKTPPLRINND
jgi:AraC family transcriptional regulator